MNTNFELSKRLKKAREYLNLSQKYVGSLLGISDIDISDIESGKKEVSNSELEVFSKIYGWSVKELLHGDVLTGGIMFARTDKKISDKDKNEIKNLIKFKSKLRKANCELL